MRFQQTYQEIIERCSRILSIILRATEDEENIQVLGLLMDDQNIHSKNQILAELSDFLDNHPGEDAVIFIQQVDTEVIRNALKHPCLFKQNTQNEKDNQS